ncbi:MAG: hypothetical protein ACREQ5_10200 [Candidatus Dormibacteria bacterium]
MTEPQEQAGSFEASRDCFEEALAWLAQPDTGDLSHGELEDQLDHRGKELLRRMYQDHLDLRAMTESRLGEVVDAEEVGHGALETGHRRPLTVIFGRVEVERFAYRHRGHANLYPADGVLNLPAERHSHGLRRLAAIEASRGSFEEAADAVGRATGVSIAKRQVEALTARAALDVEEFYATRVRPDPADDDVLVISGLPPVNRTHDYAASCSLRSTSNSSGGR